MIFQFYTLRRIEWLPFVFRVKSEDYCCWWITVYCLKFWWLYFAFNAGYSCKQSACTTWNHAATSNRSLRRRRENGIGIRLATSTVYQYPSSIYETRGHSSQLASNADVPFILLSSFLCAFFAPFAVLRHETPYGWCRMRQRTKRKSETKVHVQNTENLGDVISYWNGDKMCLWHISSSDRWHDLTVNSFCFSIRSAAAAAVVVLLTFSQTGTAAALCFLWYYYFWSYCLALDVSINAHSLLGDRIVFCLWIVWREGVFAFDCVYCRM